MKEKAIFFSIYQKSVPCVTSRFFFKLFSDIHIHLWFFFQRIQFIYDFSSQEKSVFMFVSTAVGFGLMRARE